MTLFVCDRPEHGYGCYHLEEAKPQDYPWNLNREDQAQWDALARRGYDAIATLEDIDDEMESVRIKRDSAEEQYEAADFDLLNLGEYRRLFLKRLRKGGMGESD